YPWGNKNIKWRGFHVGHPYTLGHINPLVRHSPKVKRVQQVGQHKVHHLQGEVETRAYPPARAKWDELEILAPNVQMVKPLGLELQHIGPPYLWVPMQFPYVDHEPCPSRDMVASDATVLGKLTWAAKWACRYLASSFDDGIIIIFTMKSSTTSRNRYHDIHKIPRPIILTRTLFLPMFREPFTYNPIQLLRIFLHPLLVPTNIQPRQIRQRISGNKHPRQLKKIPHHPLTLPRLILKTLPSNYPEHHVQIQISKPLFHVHQSPSRPKQLVHGSSRLGHAHELDRDEFSHLPPERAVRGICEHGVVVAQVLACPELRAGRDCHVAGCEHVLGKLPAADDHGPFKSQTDSEDWAVAASLKWGRPPAGDIKWRWPVKSLAPPASGGDLCVVVDLDQLRPPAGDIKWRWPVKSLAPPASGGDLCVVVDLDQPRMYFWQVFSQPFLPSLVLGSSQSNRRSLGHSTMIINPSARGRVKSFHHRLVLLDRPPRHSCFTPLNCWVTPPCRDVHFHHLRSSEQVVQPRLHQP
ncbi:P-glycoprotein 16, partial [Striga asiatica]